MRCLHPLTVSPYKDIKRYILVPCGKCLNCRKTKRDDLAFRLDAEYNAKDTLCSLFVTLTYSDLFVPKTYDLVTGEQFMQVSPEDVHNFFKYFRKLGKQYDLKFTYFLSSEYGDEVKFSGRPHYHAIFFIKHINSRNILADMTDIIERAWYRGFVSVQFPRASFSALNYVTKYVIKDVALELKDSYRPQFTRRSKGLGLSCIYGNKFSVGSTLKFLDSENRLHLLPRYYHTHIFNSSQLKQHQAFTKLFVEDRLNDKLSEYGCSWEQFQDYQFDRLYNDSLSNVRRFGCISSDRYFTKLYDNL